MHQEGVCKLIQTLSGLPHFLCRSAPRLNFRWSSPEQADQRPAGIGSDWQTAGSAAVYTAASHPTFAVPEQPWSKSATSDRRRTITIERSRCSSSPRSIGLEQAVGLDHFEVCHHQRKRLIHPQLSNSAACEQHPDWSHRRPGETLPTP